MTSQSSTVEVNDEMHLPHGSDWSSIREAGRKPGTARTRLAGFREQAAMGSQPERTVHHGACEHTLTHRDIETSQRGLIGLAQKGTAYGAGGLPTDRFSPPRNPVDSVTLRLRKTNTRNEITTPVLPVWSMAG